MVRQAAAQTLNYADTLPNCLRLTFHDSSWVGGVAVEMAGGPAAPLLPGRQDCNCFDNSSVIADECFSLDQLVDYWRAPLTNQQRVFFDHVSWMDTSPELVAIGGIKPSSQGLSDPMKAAVVLNGAHALGFIRSTMPHDVASGTGFGGAGPVCIGGPGPMTAQPNLFDNHYYRELYTFDVTGRGGYLYSDRALVTPSNTTSLALVKMYVENQTAFFNDWVTQFQEMGLIGVDTAPAGFGIHDGFLPGGPIARVPPMTPVPGNGFAGTGANYTGAVTLPHTLQSGGQGSFLAINGPG
ncbi:g4314 [Coccomyxa elongata]